VHERIALARYFDRTSRRSSMPTATDRPIYRSRWWIPSVSLVIGLVSLAIMAGVGALFLLGTRSETLQGIGGPARNERWAGRRT
jgi:hypothetical protein